MNLFVKRLLISPIGAHVEVTVENGTSLESVEGVITDNDYITSVEITTFDGDERIIDYSTVKGFQVTKKLDDVLKGLSEGTTVKFSYGDENEKEPNLTGIVGENDGEEAVEIITSSGEDLVLNYSIIRSLIVISNRKLTPKTVPPAPGPEHSKPHSISVPKTKKELLYQQEPEDILSASDTTLRSILNEMPRDDRLKLNRFSDSFFHGIKMNERSKMAEAAMQARAILLREDDLGYCWSQDAVLFVGYLLRRVNIFDCDVFLVCDCFEEAAYAAWRDSKYHLAGAYAITALLWEPNDIQNMVIIVANSVVKANDISGLSVFYDRLPSDMESQLKDIISDAFAAKGMALSADLNIPDALNMLKALYPADEMGKKVTALLSEGEANEKKTTVEDKQIAPPKPAEPVFVYGTISRISWSDQTGTITDYNGSTYTFRYNDIMEEALAKEIEACLRADLDGKIYRVKFCAEKSAASYIRLDDALLERARSIANDVKREDRYELAFTLCKEALATPDIRGALGELIKLAGSIFKSTQKTEYLDEALSLFEQNASCYINNAFAVMGVAQDYGFLKKYPQMREYADKAMAYSNLTAKQRITLVSQYSTLIREYYALCQDKALLARIVEETDYLKATYSADFANSYQVESLYKAHVLHHRVFAECGLDMLEEAEADYAELPYTSISKPVLEELLAELRARLSPVEEESAVIPALSEEEKTAMIDDSSNDDFHTPADEEENEEDIVPYVDSDGWDALKLTKKEVVDYALRITGPDRIPAILAYLRAGAELNGDIAPVYHTVALAANDPMEAPDYSITSLLTALAASDTDYPELNDCCMGAAFLRGSFLSGRGYDYSAQGLRDSISISQQIPALRDAYDTLAQFRNETGCAIDIYADYRNQGVVELNENMESAARHAEELYTRYILTPPREKATFARILETKKILFSRDGYLAAMLKRIVDRDQEALEAEKANFVSVYLNGSDQFSAAHINKSAVDTLMTDAWDQAGKSMQLKKNNSVLQGNLRNNLRSNVSEILGAVCQWYALSEQSAGLSWRTEEGANAYARLRPQLMSQLAQLQSECMEELETSDTPALSTGLFLLAATAKELSARLDGTWKFDQEKYLYVDFLRSNNIMLGDDFMPELTSTFCVLSDFNVLARIRRHVEEHKLSFQEQIDCIYSRDRSCNNYGTASRILAYEEAFGSAEPVSLPPNSDQYIAQTELQINILYRRFRETYALAMSYGQIIKSDKFCDTLEDTVRYWYVFCRETRNFGFFTIIVQQAEDQIHESARQYEIQLNEQLDALIASNQQYFNEHPDYAEAICTQIANQNFTVAEDWMARIRRNDFSLELQRQEAQEYLERFMQIYTDWDLFSRISNTRSSLQSILGRKEVRNKDTKGGQQLIDNWLNNGNPSNCPKIEQLLNLLGWKNVHVTQYQFTPEPKTEIYEVRKTIRSSELISRLHPIAAFGSYLENNPMYVVCLYGANAFDRLFTKMRTLDAIPGNKVILVDYALGVTDRRLLAKEMKMRESSLRNVNIVIDRMLIKYLSDNYNADLISRMLMATTMPFAYSQPYVVESVHTLPEEMFIGRRDELLKIEQADGVNLIYGGRQLGKTALLKKALSDIDGRQKQRAVLVDIKGMDCASAARRVSEELIVLKITPNAEITDDWDVLCQNIRQCLRSEYTEISYFLLMLDEADAFIGDCANFNYGPMDALKGTQQVLPGRFKYVLAGLHNIVKFNHQVALGNNSVITHIPSLKITPFRTLEAEELLIRPLSYLGFSLPSKVTVSQILATCNYFPVLIQLYAKKLIESIRTADYAGYDPRIAPPYIVSDDHLRRVMADKEFVEQIHQKFWITLTLDEDQGSYYLPLTLLIGWLYSMTPSQSGYTAGEVLRHAKDLAIRPLADLDVDKIDALLMELQDLNILRSVSHSSYLLASKNFRDLLGSDEEIYEELMKFEGAAV